MTPYVPREQVGLRFISALLLAQLVFFVALLGPAIVGLGLKVQSIVPDAEKTSALGIVAGFGALVAVISNVVFGRLSDRTTLRWGRRRPWIVAGTVAMAVGLVSMALAPTVPWMTLSWCLVQLAANAALAPFIATISDQVPQTQRASVSALLGIAASLGVLGGTYIAEIFADQMLLMFGLPSVFAIAAMLWYAFVLPDQRLDTKPPPLTASEWISTFWVSPREHPDFSLAWMSRFLVMLATFMFTTFRLFYLQDELGLGVDEAPAVITRGVLIYTIATILVCWIAGKISDATGKRKAFVAWSTVFFGIGTALLVHAETVTHFYIIEAILGAAIGVYMAVDLALVIDVLPDPDDAGKDLGVFNIANALPQTVAPLLGAMLLGVADATNQNYTLLLYTAAIAGLIGALVIIPIKKAR